MRTIDLIIARYAEDVIPLLLWAVDALRSNPGFVVRRIVIYDKGTAQGAPPVDVVPVWESQAYFAQHAIPGMQHRPVPSCRRAPLPKGVSVVPLANVGRESHTYMTHVLTYWDDLSDFTLCLPGSTMYFPYKIALARRLLDNPAAGFREVVPWEDVRDFTLGEWRGRQSDNDKYQRAGSSTLTPSRYGTTLGEWVKNIAGVSFDGRVLIPLDFCGVVSLPKSGVRSWPESVWVSMQREMAVSSNPLANHFAERLWGVWASGRGAVHLPLGSAWWE